MKRCILLIAFLLPFSVGAATQELSSFATLSVHDASGNAVTEIAPDSLVLEINKKIVPVTGMTPWKGRQYVFILDLALPSMEAIAAAREKIWNFVSALDRSDLAALVVFDAQAGLQVACPLTSDRKQWLRALNSIGELPPSTDVAGFHFAEDFNATPENGLIEFEKIKKQLVKTRDATPKSNAKMVAEKLADDLIQFGKSLSVLRGPKEVVLLSPGIPTVRFRDFGSDSDPEINLETPDTIEESSSDTGSSRRKPMMSQADNVAEALMAAECRIHAVDLNGIGKSLASGRDYLKTVAKKTGGHYFDQLTANLSPIAAPAPQLILINWPTPKELTEIQNLKITSKQNYKIVAPKKVYVPRALSLLSDIEKKFFFSQSLYHPAMSQEAAGVTALFDFQPADKNLIRTFLFLRMNGKTLLDSQDKRRSFYITGYLMNSDHELVDYFLTSMRIDIEKTHDRLVNGGLNCFDMLLSAPGDYEFKGMVVDADRSEVRTFVAPLKVPNFEDIMMTAPVIPMSLDQGVMVRREYAMNRKRGVEVTYPYETTAGLFHPDVTPTVVKNKTYYLFYRVYNLGVNSSQRPSPEIGMYLKGPNGEQKPVRDVVLSERKEMTKSDIALLFQFKITDVAGGHYKLVPYIRDGVANKTVSQELNIEVSDQ